jgi:hypothetical protein
LPIRYTAINEYILFGIRSLTRPKYIDENIFGTRIINAQNSLHYWSFINYFEWPQKHPLSPADALS